MSELNKPTKPQVSEEALEAQHKAGKLTARERVEEVLDANSFVEVGAYVQHSSRAFGLDKQAAGDGVVAGYGTIDLRPVYVYAQDFTAFDGALGIANAEKICRVYDMALKNGAPILSIMDSAGARVLEGVQALEGYAKIIKKASDASGVIPQLAVVAGSCIGASAIIAELADFVFCVEKSAQIALSGPQVLAATDGADVDTKSYGAKASVAKGIAHFAFEDEKSCFESVRALLAMLPSNNLDDVPYDFEITDDFNRQIENGYDCAGDMIAAIADNGVVIKTQADYTNVLTALMRLGGRTVGVVANISAHDEGRLNGSGCEKAARFIRFCDCFGIAVVSLVDTAGFAVCSSQEALGLPKYAAKLAYAYAEATVPLVSVMTGRAIGGAYSIMGAKGIGTDVAYAYPNAQIAPVNADAAAVMFYSVEDANDPLTDRKKQQQEYASTYANPIEAAKAGSIDDIIEPKTTRQMLISALEMLYSKRDTGIAKKHDNMPV